MEQDIPASLAQLYSTLFLCITADKISNDMTINFGRRKSGFERPTFGRVEFRAICLVTVYTWDDLRFSNTSGILPKKKLCGLLVFIGLLAPEVRGQT